jgi:ATP-dependent exoDNAse (exonuclease V) beta subunit
LNQTTFHIINAAAGSGKTYTLVLKYLELLLGSNSRRPYRELLALTFTNKAVNEMKERILAALFDLSKVEPEEIHIQKSLCKQLEINPEQLRSEAYQMLKKILLEYGSFDVITLDKFTHRIVRTFSKELQLPMGFEVLLDPSEILNETIESILDELGKDEFLSDLLLNQSLDKVRKGLSWDVQKELDEFAKLLLNENDRKPLAEIQSKDKNQHKKDEQQLKNTQKEALENINKKVNQIKDLLHENGIDSREIKNLHNHLAFLKNEDFKKAYKNQLESSLNGERSIYNKSLDENKKTIIDQIQPKLYSLFIEIKKGVGIILLIDQTLKYWSPRIILQQMVQRLELLQEKNEVRLLGEFNKKIGQLLKQEAAPYIFERLGERYQHYFLDEFQDTSQLQWSNLIPLIGNALESESLSGARGSLLIVGDPKQAIYRWRGGDIQQFLHLLNNTETPFQVVPAVERLEENYRSDGAIVEFNNRFFHRIAQSSYSEDIKKMFGEDSQQFTKKKGGYVSIKALPKEGKKAEDSPLYVQKTLNAVKEAIDCGYDQKDIAVLVRKKDQAMVIGSGLVQAGYDLVSSESLMVAQSIEVRFIIAVLKLINHPNQPEFHKHILDTFWDKNPLSDKEYHHYIQDNVHQDSNQFFNQLGSLFNFQLYFWEITKLSLTGVIEILLEKIPILTASNSFIQAFLEDVFEHTRVHSQSISTYLNRWESQKEKLRLSMPQGMNAIEVMTIHQAKGLEFPVVILPFMDSPIHSRVQEKLWFPLRETNHQEIAWAWIYFSSEWQLYGDLGKRLYEEHRLKQELDAMNVLYVALTRAVNQLFIITKEVSISSKSKSYAHLFQDFVQSQRAELTEEISFEWGIKTTKEKQDQTLHKAETTQNNISISTQWRSRLVASKSFNIGSKESMRKGIFVHELLAKITHEQMLSKVLEDAFLEKKYDQKTKNSITQMLHSIVHHPKLNTYFKEDSIVFCEKDILIPQSDTIRPDRINRVSKDHVCIMDYKTGTPKEEDQKQINAYGIILEKMGFSIVEKHLIYIDEMISIKTIV